MKKNQYTYSDREITEIIQKAKALIECLRLPGLEKVATAQTRYYPPERSEERQRYLGYCPDCKSPLRQGRYSVYCHECWSQRR